DHHGDALPLQQGQCRRTVRGIQVVVTAQRQGIGQRLTQGAIILDQPNASLAHLVLPPETGCGSTGSTSSAQLPCPGRLRRRNAPPWAWATDLTTDTPSPVPCSRVV